jgi:hypothetical protein
MHDVTVSPTGAKFRMEVKAGPHTLVADEPSEIADRDPVHRALTGRFHIHTEPGG